MADQLTESLPHRGKERLRTYGGNVVLLLLATVLCVIAAEAFLRLFPGLLPIWLHQRFSTQKGIAHPYIGHLHTPHDTGVIAERDFTAVHHTDGHGFRNSWPWPIQAEIVTLGDSLTFGYGVGDAEAWPALLAQALPQQRVVNLGLIGASPEQYVRVYETFGHPLCPKLVVIGLYMGNDFSDAEIFHQWMHAGAPGNYLVWRDLDKDGPVKGFLRRHSYLTHLLLHARTVYRAWRVSEPRRLVLGPHTEVQLQPSALTTLTRDTTPTRPAFQLVVQALTRLHTLATAQGTQVLVVFLPTKEQVYLPVLEESVRDPSAPLRAVLEAQRIPYFDLLPAFRHHAQAHEMLFFEVDSHPNRQGYRLIAQEVLAHLRHTEVGDGSHGIGVPVMRACGKAG
jgi:lysophospholipase L1-like esterase